MKDSSEVAIVVPAFNEEKAITPVLERLSRLPYRVIIVDDGSSDDTSGVALKYPVTVLRHIFNLGQGAALQTGISYALASPATRYIVTFDSDGQHSAGDIARLLAPLRGGTHDVVLGTRFVQGRSTNMPLRKRAVLALAVVFTRLSTGLALTDTHNGLRAFTAEAARKIRIQQNRMAHASEILSQIAGGRLRWCEVPVTIAYTNYSVAKGQSTLNSINILWDMMVGRLR